MEWTYPNNGKWRHFLFQLAAWLSSRGSTVKPWQTLHGSTTLTLNVKVQHQTCINPNRPGLLSTRNALGIGTLCQALYLKNYWSYDHETSQNCRGQKTVEPKMFLLASDYPTSGYESQRQILLFLYECSYIVVFFCIYELDIFTSRSHHVWEYVIAIICYNF